MSSHRQKRTGAVTGQCVGATLDLTAASPHSRSLWPCRHMNGWMKVPPDWQAQGRVGRQCWQPWPCGGLQSPALAPSRRCGPWPWTWAAQQPCENGAAAGPAAKSWRGGFSNSWERRPVRGATGDDGQTVPAAEGPSGALIALPPASARCCSPAALGHGQPHPTAPWPPVGRTMRRRALNWLQKQRAGHLGPC